MGRSRPGLPWGAGGRQTPDMTPDKRNGLLDRWAALFEEGRLLPLVGSGLSQNVADPAKRPPSWPELCARVARDLRTGSPDLEFLLGVGDCLGALTLLEVANRPRFRCALHRAFQHAAPSAEDLPVHRALWSVRWPSVVTTNVDDLLEIAAPSIEAVDYGDPRLVQRLRQGSPARADARPLVVHAHGGRAETAAAQTNSLVMTWRDYVQIYGMSAERLALLVGHVCALTPEPARARHRSLLQALLEGAWRSVSPQMGPVEGRGAQQLVRHLMEESACLMIGFSMADPLWHVLLRQADADTEGEFGPHFLLGEPDHGQPGGVELVPLTDWGELVPLLLDLGARIARHRVPGSLLERRSRREGYGDLRTRYAGLSWLYSDEASVVPFTSLWTPPPGTSGRVIWQVAPQRWGLDPWIEPVATAMWGARARRDPKLVDEAKVRVAGFSSEGAELRLDIQQTWYRQFLSTNHLVANYGNTEIEADSSLASVLRAAFQDPARPSPRDALCPDVSSLQLSPAAPCANHLGVSTLLLGDFHDADGACPVLVCPLSRGQVSSPRDLIPTASGSVDWPVRQDATRLDEVLRPDELRPGDLDLAAEAARELTEECFSNLLPAASGLPLGLLRQVVASTSTVVRDEVLRHHELIGFAQNVERGGKPELFFLGGLRGTANEFLARMEPSWELDGNWYGVATSVDHLIAGAPMMLLLPSPITPSFELSAGFEGALELVAHAIRTPTFNPVLRAHLCFTLVFAAQRHPERLGGWLGEHLPGLAWSG